MLKLVHTPDGKLELYSSKRKSPLDKLVVQDEDVLVEEVLSRQRRLLERRYPEIDMTIHDRIIRHYFRRLEKNNYSRYAGPYIAGRYWRASVTHKETRRTKHWYCPMTVEGGWTTA